MKMLLLLHHLSPFTASLGVATPEVGLQGVAGVGEHEVLAVLGRKGVNPLGCAVGLLSLPS